MVCLKPFSLKLTVADDVQDGGCSLLLDPGERKHGASLPGNSRLSKKPLLLQAISLWVIHYHDIPGAFCLSQGLPVYLSWILLESDGGSAVSWGNRRQLVTFLGSPLPASVPSLRP